MLEIIKTADGSNTIFNSEVGENYHSIHGALQESRHVFLEMGLKYFLANDATVTMTNVTKNIDHETVSMLEAGFGTGLNFLLSANFCEQEQINLDYCGIEAYPLSQQMIAGTGYEAYFTSDIWKRFIAAYQQALLAPYQINQYCRLQVANCKLLGFESQKQYDIVYFDAFAAARQPEMWNEEAISHTINFLKRGGVFVTYAITGNLKRMLKTLDCKVEKVQGAPGKREMLRAVKMS